MAFFMAATAQQKDSTVSKMADSLIKKHNTPDTARPSPPVTLTGSVDGYYRYNFSNPKTGTNDYTSFTNSQSSFELGMASLRADHSFGRVSATADLGFGRRAEEYSYNDAAHPTLLAALQAFVSYQAGSRVKLTMGKWGTHIGYEAVDAYSNRNYSMDYMYTFGPFFHTGLKADLSLGGPSALMIGIANPTDFSTTTSSTKVFIGQLSTGTPDGKWKAFLNFQGYGGLAKDSVIPTYTLYKSLSQFDLVINATFSSKIGMGFNSTVESVNSSQLEKRASWWGAAIYLNYDPTAVFGLTCRGEYFGDKNGLRINPIDLKTNPGETRGLNVFDLTLSGNYRVGANLTVIPELRFDEGSKLFFDRSDGAEVKATLSGLFAVVYHF